MGAGEMANEGTFRPLKLILPPGQDPQRRADRADGHYSDAVPDRDRHHHQGAGDRRCRSACRAAISAPIPACASSAGAPNGIVLRHPRYRPRRLGRLRDPRRRRPVPHHGARRHPHHPARAAGDAAAVPHRGVFAARRIPPAPGNSAAGWASARAIASWRRASCRPISTARNFRPGACRAARGRAGPLHGRQGGNGQGRIRRQGKRLPLGPAISCVSKPAAAAAMVRRRAVARPDPARSRCRLCLGRGGRARLRRQGRPTARRSDDVRAGRNHVVRSLAGEGVSAWRHVPKGEGAGPWSCDGLITQRATSSAFFATSAHFAISSLSIASSFSGGPPMKRKPSWTPRALACPACASTARRRG